METMLNKRALPNEPILTFRLSRPDRFHCSACPDLGDDSPFPLDLWTSDLVEVFRDHVLRHHPKNEAFSRAAVRRARKPTKRK